MKKKSTPKLDSEVLKGFPFKVNGLSAADMEILLSHEMNDMLGHISCTSSTQNSMDGILICSSSEDSVGIGNLLAYPFKDILQLGRGEDGLYVWVKTTEGNQKDWIFDFKVIFA